MKKKPSYTLNNQKPIEAKGTVNGPVTSYFLSPEELELYRLMPVVDYELEKKLNRSFSGGVA